MVCGSCGFENRTQANFCRVCGRKLKEECDCWVKKEPHNCGMERCPGYKLFEIEKHKSKRAGTVGGSDSFGKWVLVLRKGEAERRLWVPGEKQLARLVNENFKKSGREYLVQYPE